MPDRAIDSPRGTRVAPGAVTADAWRGTVEVVDATLCEGHFPGMPIVPAVAMLVCVEAALDAWRGSVVASYAALRFRTPVGPGDDLDLDLTRRADGTLAFALRRAGERVADGRIEEHRR